jgi:hypothetical protein
MQHAERAETLDNTNIAHTCCSCITLSRCSCCLQSPSNHSSSCLSRGTATAVRSTTAAGLLPLTTCYHSL